MSLPMDISIPLRAGADNVNAFHLPPFTRKPFAIGDFVGAVKAGGPCNVYDLAFNPHGNGTHTECVGHISPKEESINDCLKEFFFHARLLTIDPVRHNNDLVIMNEQILPFLDNAPQALILRTLPNTEAKLNFQYSGSNPCFLHHEAAKSIANAGVLHLLIDTPSVDKEEDGGDLLAHHAFWNYPENTRMNATISELIYVPNAVKDGDYLLNLQIASFVNDASPSKPVLYPLI